MTEEQIERLRTILIADAERQEQIHREDGTEEDRRLADLYARDIQHFREAATLEELLRAANDADVALSDIRRYIIEAAVGQEIVSLIHSIGFRRD